MDSFQEQHKIIMWEKKILNWNKLEKYAKILQKTNL
jgi:hypothetical protein